MHLSGNFATMTKPPSASRAEAKKARKALRGARPRTVMVRVSSPTVPGAVEIVEYKADPLEIMFRAKQLTKRQWRSVEAYRNAREIIYGQAGGALDFDRVRGAGLPGSPPVPAFMEACEILRTAKAKLYALDHTILVLVLGGSEQQHGLNFQQCAERLSAKKVAVADNPRFIAQRFKIALDEMANALWGEERPGSETRLRSYMVPGSKPMGSDVEAVPQARAVHADGRKIFRTGG